jgi:PAS domain-containing protein
MTETTTTPAPQPASWPAAQAVRSSHGGVRNVRAAMYLAFGVMALAVLLQGWLVHRQQEARLMDAKVLDLSRQQWMMIPRIEHAVTVLLDAAPAARRVRAEEVATLLSRTTANAQALDRLLATDPARAGEGAATQPQALVQWRARHAELLQRAEGLQRSDLLEAEPGLRLQAMNLHAAVLPALAAAQQLHAGLLEAAQARSEAMDRSLHWSLAGLLALLGLLSIAVVEPAARAVSRRVRRLAAQSADVQRLALVAERTTAIVLVTDADDRVQWVNAAFERTTGWAPGRCAGSESARVAASPA